MSVRKRLGQAWLRANGWEPEGDKPTPLKYVLIAAPHTSNWDLVFALALAAVVGVDLQWIGKRELFRGPAGPFLRALGGIPVRRDRHTNFVTRAAKLLRDADRLALMVPAEGTRSRAPHWKSGFLHIAREADVPVVLGFLDFRRKRGGFGPALDPHLPTKEFMDRARAFYADKTGKYPDQFGPVRLSQEEEDGQARP